MVKHTPGPWHVANRGNHIEVTSNGGMEIHRMRLYGGEDCYDDAIRVANANLIAAAPGLFATLKAIADNAPKDHPEREENTGNRDDDFHHGMAVAEFAIAQMAREILAKIEGADVKKA